MDSKQVEAMRECVGRGVASFFASMSDREVQNFIMAPYREVASMSQREWSEERERLALA